MNKTDETANLGNHDNNDKSKCVAKVDIEETTMGHLDTSPAEAKPYNRSLSRPKLGDDPSKTSMIPTPKDAYSKGLETNSYSK